MQKGKVETVAAIDVGSNSMRMTIAQITPEGKIKILEDLWKPTHIGRDTFAYGRIQVESIHDTCETLNGFCNLMQDYKVKHYRAVATSGIREAENREYVLEQIRLKTDLEIEIINNAQERFLMYKAVRDHSTVSQKIHDKSTLILDIGSGGVEISAYGGGSLKFTEYVKVGSLRLREILADIERMTLDFPSIMEEFVESRVGFLEPQLKEMNIEYFIGLGGELRTITRLNKSSKGENFITRDGFAKLYFKLHTMTTEQIAQEYSLLKNQAEILLPSIIIFYRFLKMTNAQGVYAPMVSLRHGILADMADEKFDTGGKQEALNDILSSVWYIGQKYSIDEVHSTYIERICASIFEQTAKIHGMGEREKFYLQVASILHDIGKHVNLNQHDVHSYNIIRFQDIMGFSDSELNLVASIAKYHSERAPQLTHENYNSLSESYRIVVSKLSAILKLAEALDISHKQKINEIDITSSGRELHFRVKACEDTLLEEWHFDGNARFFEEVMGCKPIIKRRG